jgi:hypothetical protein
MSNQAIKSIVDSLQAIFAPLDAEVLAGSLVWAKGRRQALAEFRASDEYQDLHNKTWALYERLFAIAGGKSWYQALNGASDKALEDFVTKNCAAIAARRNASIAKKLVKALVTAVKDQTYTATSDGFNGVYVLETDTGEKAMNIKTVRAGGYNVQCLHLRVLVKIR